jgi:hypothetical protein
LTSAKQGVKITLVDAGEQLAKRHLINFRIVRHQVIWYSYLVGCFYKTPKNNY